MTFANALQLLIENKDSYIRIEKWKEDVKIKIDEDTFDAPILIVESRYGKVAWIPTQIEMLTENWNYYKEGE